MRCLSSTIKDDVLVDDHALQLSTVSQVPLDKDNLSQNILKSGRGALKNGVQGIEYRHLDTRFYETTAHQVGADKSRASDDQDLHRQDSTV